MYPLELTFRQEPGLHGNGSGLCRAVGRGGRRHWSSRVDHGVDPVLSSFQVIGPDRGQENTPVSYSKCGPLESLPPHIHYECFNSVAPDSLVQLVENWLNELWGQEGWGHYLCQETVHISVFVVVTLKKETNCIWQSLSKNFILNLKKNENKQVAHGSHLSLSNSSNQLTHFHKAMVMP